MTEIRMTTPENPDCPIIVEHDEFMEMGCSDGDVMINLKFDTYELDFSYPIINPTKKECSECGDMIEMAGTGIPEITVSDGNKCIFNMNFNKNWLLLLDIKKDKNSRLYFIKINIINNDDLESCEICENNRFNFKLTSVVDSYSFYYYFPPKGEFEKHPPDPKEELPEEIKEELK